MTPPKPLFVVTQDTGGASVAALRLLDALRANDIDATMLTYYKQIKHPHVQSVLPKASTIEKFWLRTVMRRAMRQSEVYRVQHHAMWSSNRLQNPFHNILNRSEANLLHLHWVGTGLLPLAALPKLNKPIIWTLHDMWAFTGGCHYSQGCSRYQTHCQNCPLLDNPHKHDTSYHVFEDKLKHWRDVPMTIITPSRWLADCARQSVILGSKNIEVIPNPIDTTEFYPFDKTCARKLMKLPADKKLILFGAGYIHAPGKGFSALQTALAELNPDTTELVLFGGGDVDARALPVRVHPQGVVDDLRLLLLYNAADVLVLPSREDNLPNTVMEALACGTPCVAFNIGGMPDMIDHQQNGYLAQPFEVADLAKGIEWVLSEADAAVLSHHARQKVLSHFSMDTVAKQYITVYERVLQESKL
jgi:glycosyltransferase involved in cell wall biosynthesis